MKERKKERDEKEAKDSKKIHSWLLDNYRCLGHDVFIKKTSDFSVSIHFLCFLYQIRLQTFLSFWYYFNPFFQWYEGAMKRCIFASRRQSIAQHTILRVMIWVQRLTVIFHVCIEDARQHVTFLRGKFMIWNDVKLQRKSKVKLKAMI